MPSSRFTHIRPLTSNRSKVRRIIFSGDFLRPVDHGFRPSQTENIRWLYLLLRHGVAAASSLPTQVVAWESGVDPAEIYEICDASPDVAGWASLYDMLDQPAEYLEVIDRTFSGSFVIAFEMAESVKRSLCLLGIPYVDFTIHPIRYMPDVFFAVQTNDAAVADRLRDWHASTTSFWRFADLTRASVIKIPTAPLAGSDLVVGQVNIDRSLIRGGQFVDLSACSDGLLRRIGRTSQVLYKPHPYNSGDFGIYATGIPFSAINRVTTNSYILLAQADLRRVAAVSSSLVYEAKFFEKESFTLIESPFDIVDAADDVAPGRHASVVRGYLDADFWRDVLAPYSDVTRKDWERFEHPPNMLRLSLRNFWGYNEITSDFLSSLYESGKTRTIVA